jgi:hypothetical protein
MGAPRIPTEIGDVLILRTTESYTTHAVGLISERDQQDFSQHTKITHLERLSCGGRSWEDPCRNWRANFRGNLDTGAWSEIPR